MFYQGNLQSGIATALRESKHVVCFVKDDFEESHTWEHDLLQDDQVASDLASKAITLMIRAGSQESSFLSAYYTISVVPTLLVITNGSLRIRLEAGLGKDEIKRGVVEALSTNPNSAGSGRDARPSQTPQAAPLVAETGGTYVYAASAGQDFNSQSLIDEQEKETGKGKERQESFGDVSSTATGNPTTDPTKKQQAQHAKDQRKRQREAKAERERIVRQIAADKVERRAKEELRKVQAKAESEELQATTMNEPVGRSPQTADKGKSIMGKECNLQIRTLDGSTLRRRFPTDQSLGTNVRHWIEQENASRTRPYTFRQILAPLPNRVIADSDEEETLGSLGLAPSATLVMVPVKGCFTATSDQAGFISRLTASIYSIVAGWIALLLHYLRVFLGLDRTDSAQKPRQSEVESERNSTGTKLASRAGIKIRRLHNQDEKKDDHQLYNGNQLNFEPRRDDDDEDGQSLKSRPK